MRATIISIEQQLVNSINAKQDFTYPLITKRYIVGVRTLFVGKNPSLDYKSIYNDVYAAIREEDLRLTFGGWLDTETGDYYVDSGVSYNSLKVALYCAKSFHQKAIYDSVDNKVIII